jgi:hypothetical protein
MTTIGEVVSRLRGVFKAAKEDAFLTDRSIYSMFIKYMKTLLRRHDNERKLLKHDEIFETLEFVELEEVDRIEAGCSGIQSNCKIMRTVEKLPNLFSGNNGSLIRKVYSIDGTKEFISTSPYAYIAISASTNFKYNKARYYWFKNGYLYFPNCDWKAVSIEGLWEGSLDGFCTISTDDCTPMQEKTIPVPDYLIAEIEQLVEQELFPSMKIPGDGADDNQNILR